MAFYIKTHNSAGQMPEPAHQGVTITEEPIWSSDTGRAQNGKLVGDIVAYKRTVEVRWPPLSFADSKKLRDALVNAGEFFSIWYNDFNGSTEETLTVYCSNIPRTLYSVAPGIQYHQDITVTFVQQ